MILICQFCKKEFKTGNKKNKYCSRECYMNKKHEDSITIKKCPVCNNDFEILLHDYNKRKYCSQKCKNKEQEKTTEYVCEYCEKPFYLNWAKSKRKYCSLECSNLSKKTGEEKKCGSCGKKVYAPLRDLEREENKYCSNECYYKSRRNKISVSCKKCGNIFETVQSEIDRGGSQYCSKKCFISDGIFGSVKRKYRDDLGMYFRSSWEANYARILNKKILENKIIKWEYEKETIDLKTCFYVPDFKIFFINNHIEYHEVKGYLTDKAKNKMNKMNEMYPEKTLVLIDAPKYIEIGAEYKDRIEHWEKGRLI